MAVKRSWRSLSVPSLAGTTLLEVNDTFFTYNFNTEGTLQANLRLLPVATPSTPTAVEIVIKQGALTLNGFSFIVFGRSITQAELDFGGSITAYYTGEYWVVDGFGTAQIGAPGTDGIPVEMDVISGWISWRYVGDVDWIPLVEVTSLTGPQGDPGTPIELRVNGFMLQWKYIDEVDWIDLYDLEPSFVLEIFAEQDPVYPISYLKYVLGGVEYYVTDIPKADGVLTPGVVVWTGTGYEYNVSPAAYYIRGELYTSDYTYVPLTPPDLTQNRIDLIVGDIYGDVYVIEGISAENPIKPQLDPSTQIELTNILLVAGTTTPPYMTQSVIFNENIEWGSHNFSGTALDFDSLIQPYDGLKAAEATNIYHTNSWGWIKAGTVTLGQYSTFSLRLYLKAVMAKQHNIIVQFFFGVNPLGTPVVLNINKNLINEYQLIGIPIGDLGTIGVADRVRFTWVKQGANTAHEGFHMDLVKLEGGVPNPPSLTIHTADSVVGDGKDTNPIRLENDEATPGASKYYGTDESENKGFHTLPEGYSGFTLKEDLTEVTIDSGDTVEVVATNDITAELTEPTPGHKVLTLDVQHPASDDYDHWKLLAGSSIQLLYGYLYNWYAGVDVRNIAADGWHLPSKTETTTLMNYLKTYGDGGWNNAAVKMAEVGTTYWTLGIPGATNSSKFNAKGAGLRAGSNGAFWDLYYSFEMLVQEDFNSDLCLIAAIFDNDTSFYGLDAGNEYTQPKKDGASIRLVKDSTTLSNGEEGIYIGNDGKVYRTVCIGSQEWLADNLCETKYRNGDDISEVTDNVTWAALNSGARCSYDNDESNAFISSNIELNVHSQDLVEFEGLNDVEVEVEEISPTHKKVKISVEIPEVAITTDNSITGDGNITPVELVNDEDIPGIRHYYGTDESGDKGYHELPEIIVNTYIVYNETELLDAWAAARVDTSKSATIYIGGTITLTANRNFSINHGEARISMIGLAGHELINIGVYTLTVRRIKFENLQFTTAGDVYLTVSQAYVYLYNCRFSSDVGDNPSLSGVKMLTSGVVDNPSGSTVRVYKGYHGLSTGNTVRLSVWGFPEAEYLRGLWTITVINQHYFTVDGAIYEPGTGGNQRVDISYGKRIHISCIDSGVNFTGGIELVDCMHMSSVVSVNREGIQPIIITNATTLLGDGHSGTLYLQMTGLRAMADYDTFSRLLLLATTNTSYKVTGDLSWYYYPTQQWPGTGNIGTTSKLLKRGSVDDLRGDYIPDEPLVELLGLDSNKNIRKGSSINSKMIEIEYATKNSTTDEGILKQLAIDDDFLYICTTAGTAGNAIWKKTMLVNT